MGRIYTFNGGEWKPVNDMYVRQGTGWVKAKEVWVYRLKPTTDELAPATYEWVRVKSFSPPTIVPQNVFITSPKEDILPAGTVVTVRVTWDILASANGYRVGVEVWDAANDGHMGSGWAPQENGAANVDVVTTGGPITTYATANYTNEAGSGPRARSVNNGSLPGA